MTLAVTSEVTPQGEVLHLRRGDGQFHVGVGGPDSLCGRKMSGDVLVPVSGWGLTSRWRWGLTSRWRWCQECDDHYFAQQLLAGLTNN